MSISFDVSADEVKAFQEKMEETLGKEGIALYGKSLPLIKRVDDIYCFFRHDLSYIPLALVHESIAVLRDQPSTSTSRY